MNQLECKAAMDRSLNFAMYNNDVPLVKHIDITNKGEEVVFDITVKLSFWPSFADKYSYHLEELPAGKTIAIRPVEIRINPDYLFGLTERMKGQVDFSVVSGETVFCEERHELTLLAFDEWNGGLSLPEIIAAFVIPNCSMTDMMIKQAAGYMQRWTGSSAIDGYQSGSPNRAKQQMAAIFQAIQDIEIDYANPPASFEAVGQRVRLPEIIEQSKTGTCLDLALLYASACEAAGLNPLIVFIEGHAFAGSWLVDETFPEGAYSDYSMLAKRAMPGIDEICLVEATGMTRNRMFSFDQAAEAAMGHFTNPQKFHYFVDVKRARISQIRPLPVRMEYQAYLAREQLPTGQAEAGAQAPSQVNKITFVESKEPVQESRIQNWQRQLLDLSLRNNLLNLRFHGSTITLLCPDIYALEDALAAGREFGMLPIPGEMTDSVRDFATYKSRTGNDMLAEVTASEFRQGRLRTMLSERILAKNVVEIYRKAKTNMEENGANILYLAIGTLRWYETPAAETPRYAPLILMPLEIVKKSAAFGYVIRKRDEDPIFNYTLVEFLKNTYGIDLSNVEQMPNDDHGVDVRTLFAVVNHQIMNQSRWGIEETAVISAFSFNKFVMWNDLRSHGEELQKNKIVNALVQGTVDADFPGEVRLPAESGNLDEVLGSYTQLLMPISADASQLTAIYAANAGESFVLHGPPGTGKSQTITNMIANLTGSGKTVLFVAEKMAALSVVEKRLSQIGLGPFCLELHSNKSNKKDILKKLEETLNLGIYHNSADWDITLLELQKVKEQLNGYVNALHQGYEIGFSAYDAIQKLNEYRDIQAVLLFTPQDAFGYTREQLATAREYVRKLEVAGKGCGQPWRNPLRQMKQTTFSLLFAQQLPGLLTESIRTYLALTQNQNKFHHYLKLPDVSQISLADLAVLLELGRISMADDTFMENIWNADYDKTQEALNDAVQYAAGRSRVLECFDERVEEIDIDQIIGDYNISQTKHIFARFFGRNKAFKELVGAARLGVKLDKKRLPEELQKIRDLKRQRQQFAANQELFTDLFGRALTVVDDFDRYQQTVRHAARIHGQWNMLLQRNGDLAGTVRENLSAIATNQGTERQECMELMRQYLEITDEVLQQTKAGQLKTCSLAEIRDVLSLWQGNIKELSNICAYNGVAAQAESLHLSAVAAAYEGGSIQGDLLSCFEKAFYTAWLDQVVGMRPELQAFTKEIHEDEVRKFKDLDQRYSALVRQEIFARLVNRLPKHSENINANSEMGILVRAIHSGGRGVALRKLFSRIPHLLNRLAPCMLMSPISVAQYLEAGFPPFDVVIFDEASQMPTHEAVGAIARGKSLIVVGDPKQLPPTTFFSVRQMEQEDDLMLTDLESILDDCMAVNMPSRSLTWHYRSRHESLIAFSNYNFYEGKLLTFPSFDDEDTQIEFVNTHGIYARGTTRQNRQEAEAVADAIQRLAREYPNQSIGVVALSQAQQTLIEDLLDARYGEDPELELYNEKIYEPVFVKNLENVQGDERDIIIFSVGYGKDEKGYMGMNFGPINKDGGWRRLNVAISRARRKLMVFSSIEAEDIDLSRSSAAGVLYLRNFLQYARSGARYIPATNPSALAEMPVSSVEQDVCGRLEQAGYTVHKQVGKSKYKIPLAVLGADGKYLLGIQFDGPFYKNARTARDRELLLDSVLKGLSWELYHIWSQRWLAYPEEEWNSLLEYLQQAGDKQQGQQELVDQRHPKYQADFTTTETKIVSRTEEYYKMAALEPVSLSTGEFYVGSSTQLIQSQIEQIICLEAPVSFTAVCRKIAAAWGMKRVGSRIAKRIQDLMIQIPCREVQGNRFYWGSIDPEAWAEYRLPRNEQERRQPEEIVPDEIFHAAQAVIREQIALSEGLLAKEVANLFGYTRVTESTAAKFADVLRYGVEVGALGRDESGKYIEKLANGV